MLKKFFLLVFFLVSLISTADEPGPRVLIICAHPDDEATFAATVYKITHEQKGTVDLAVITNGEAGYKYSLLAEPFYNLNLTNEDTGRKYLPEIRKSELMAAGRIIGINRYYFFDQVDNHYTLDPDTVLKEVWNVRLIKKRLAEILNTGKYEFVFCLRPTLETHGHHKAATILALDAVNAMKSMKPIVLGISSSNKDDTVTVAFHGLKNYPITSISDSAPAFVIDRNTSFGYNNKLNYKIIVNWEIAEHKSQGTMHTGNRSDYENFWYFDANGSEGREKARKFFELLNKFVYK